MSKNDRSSGTNGVTPPGDCPTLTLLQFNAELETSDAERTAPFRPEARQHRDLNEIYQRANLLVRVIREGGRVCGIRRPPNSPKITALPPAVLRERLAKAARFVKVVQRNGEIQIV